MVSLPYQDATAYFCYLGMGDKLKSLLSTKKIPYLIHFFFFFLSSKGQFPRANWRYNSNRKQLHQLNLTMISGIKQCIHIAKFLSEMTTELHTPRWHNEEYVPFIIRFCYVLIPNWFLFSKALLSVIFWLLMMANTELASGVKLLFKQF